MMTMIIIIIIIIITIINNNIDNYPQDQDTRLMSSGG